MINTQIKIYSTYNLVLRLLEDYSEDYKLIEKWYKEESIYSQYEKRILSLEEIEKKYAPRTKPKSESSVFVIEANKVPIGIIDYQLINDKKISKLNIQDNTYEINIFIGELNYRNRRIAYRSINSMITYLLKNKTTNSIIACPLKENLKGIKCFRKCGFNIINEYKENNNTYILMLKKLE